MGCNGLKICANEGHRSSQLTCYLLNSIRSSLVDVCCLIIDQNERSGDPDCSSVLSAGTPCCFKYALHVSTAMTDRCVGLQSYVFTSFIHTAGERRPTVYLHLTLKTINVSASKMIILNTDLRVFTTHQCLVIVPLNFFSFLCIVHS